MQGPEDEGMKWSRTRIGVWQREVSGGLGWGDWWRIAKEARPGTLRRGGGGRPTWAGLVSQKPGRRETVRMERGAESKEGMFLPGEAGVTGLQACLKEMGFGEAAPPNSQQVRTKCI